LLLGLLQLGLDWLLLIVAHLLMRVASHLQGRGLDT